MESRIEGVATDPKNLPQLDALCKETDRWIDPEATGVTFSKRDDEKDNIASETMKETEMHYMPVGEQMDYLRELAGLDRELWALTVNIIEESMRTGSPILMPHVIAEKV